MVKMRPGKAFNVPCQAKGSCGKPLFRLSDAVTHAAHGFDANIGARHAVESFCRRGV